MKTIAEIFRSYGVLDDRGRHINGTDKETNHRYGSHYERILMNNPYSSLRHNTKLMMEVGIADGSSLLAWRDVFPTAICVGMDIYPSDKAHGDRIEFHLGDQRVKEDCERAAGGRQFDFICEDASHQLQDTLLTLLYLWPFVRPGGLYVVEEFAGVVGLRDNIKSLWPFAAIVDTVGPFGGIEPLVVLKKPYRYE